MPELIHASAVIDPQAELAADVRVGPYAVIGPGVTIGAGTEIGSGAQLEGPTRLGARNRIFPHACVGLDPQDLKYEGGPTRLVIGKHNVIREYVTINRGTESGGGLTRIGDRNLVMAYVHIAHDCRLGNEVIMSNSVTLGGHCVADTGQVVGFVGQNVEIVGHTVDAAGHSVDLAGHFVVSVGHNVATAGHLVVDQCFERGLEARRRRVKPARHRPLPGTARSKSRRLRAASSSRRG